MTRKEIEACNAFIYTMGIFEWDLHKKREYFSVYLKVQTIEFHVSL